MQIGAHRPRSTQGSSFLLAAVKKLRAVCSWATPDPQTGNPGDLLNYSTSLPADKFLMSAGQANVLGVVRVRTRERRLYRKASSPVRGSCFGVPRSDIFANGAVGIEVGRKEVAGRSLYDAMTELNVLNAGAFKVSSKLLRRPAPTGMAVATSVDLELRSRRKGAVSSETQNSRRPAAHVFPFKNDSESYDILPYRLARLPRSAQIVY